MRFRILLPVCATAVLLTSCGAASPKSVNPTGYLYVSVSGSDKNACTSSSPCATFQRAYAVARLGQTVYVTAGAYPPQKLKGVADKAQMGVSAHVTIMPAPGASVTIGDLEIGSGTAADGPRHLTISGIRDDGLANGCDWSISPGSNDVTLNHVAACSIFIKGATATTVENSDFYGCTATAPDVPCTNSWIFPYPGTDNIKILDNSFHDYRAPASTGVHFQCFFDGGGTNVTFTGNKFWNCEYFDIFFQLGDWCNCNPPGFDGLTITGNVFAEPFDGNGNTRNTDMLFDAGDVPDLSNVVVGHNSFTGGTFEIEDQSVLSNFQIVDNIIGQSDCISGATYGGNIWQPSQTCDPTDLTSIPYGYELGDGRLVLAPSAAHAVEGIFAACAEGALPAAVAKGLTSQGVDLPWTPARVTQIATNTMYLGRAVGAAGADPALVYASRFKNAQRTCAG